MHVIGCVASGHYAYVPMDSWIAQAVIHDVDALLKIQPGEPTMLPHAIPAEPVTTIPIDMSSVVTHDTQGVIVQDGGLLPLGVHFGLPEKIYHADPGLGSTDLKNLYKHPLEFYHNKLSPDRPADNDTPDKQKGRAFHKITLEGLEPFKKSYLRAPQIEDYSPRPLRTSEDIVEYCKANGLPHTFKVKAEGIKRVKDHSSEILIWDEHLKLIEEMAQRNGMEILKADVYDEVVRAATVVTMNPNLANAFKGGAPEVSVIWVDEYGIRCKCRLDLLKPRTIVDLKKITNVRGVPMDIALMLYIGTYRLDMQVQHYFEGYAALYQAAQEGRVYGTCPLPEGWQQRIAEPEAMTFTLVFHQMDGAPISVGRTITPDSSILLRAARDNAEAKRRYIENKDRFGDGQWLCEEPLYQLEDKDIPGYLRERAEELV
jgi:hypothetical protein